MQYSYIMKCTSKLDNELQQITLVDLVKELISVRGKSWALDFEFKGDQPSFISVNAKLEKLFDERLSTVQPLNVNKKDILVNSRLSIGLVSSLHENKFLIEIDEWSKKLFSEILNQIFSQDDKSNFVIPHLVKNFLCLYNMNKDKEESVIGNIFPMLVLVNFLISSRALNEKKSNEIGEFELFLKLLGGKLKLEYDKEGNSFLHLCNNEKLFKHVLKFTSDVNHYHFNHDNVSGYITLHETANMKNLNKDNFLFKNGVNSDIENEMKEIFWTFDPQQKNDSLYLYRLYKQYGQVLKLHSEIAKQKGLNYDFDAVAFAVSQKHKKFYLRSIEKYFDTKAAELFKSFYH